MLEYAVRPFTAPNSQGKIIIPSTPSATTQRAMITWGSKSTNLPTPAPTKDFNVVCCSEELSEVTRVGEVVKIPIQEPAEGEQPHVSVFRSKILKLNKKSGLPFCESPLDQMLSADFQLDPAGGGDLAGQLGLWDPDVPDDNKCTAKWALNNNTAGQ